MHHNLTNLALIHYHAPPKSSPWCQTCMQVSTYSPRHGQLQQSPFRLVSTRVIHSLLQQFLNTFNKTSVNTLITEFGLRYLQSSGRSSADIKQSPQSQSATVYRWHLHCCWVTCICPTPTKYYRSMPEMAAMMAKANKHSALTISGSSGKLFNPGLYTNGNSITCLSDQPVKFLGSEVKFFPTCTVPNTSSAIK